MHQAHETAGLYMSEAVRKIDKQFDEGYAESSPELVGMFMLTAAIDFATSMIIKNLQLRNI